MIIFGDLERIEHCRAQPSDVAIVARHQRQIVGQRGRREQAIDNGDGPDRAHATPLIGHSVVDAEHASIECGLYFPQPAFERSRLASISGASTFDGRRISPGTSVLRKISSSAIDAYQADTCASQRAPSRTSEMMLVSIR